MSAAKERESKDPPEDVRATVEEHGSVGQGFSPERDRRERRA